MSTSQNIKKEQNNFLVSVIIPNYSHSQFLEKRINSILSQTYQNFELIILDDCSPDNNASKNIIESYRNNKKVSHIVYNKKNSGSTFLQWEKGISLSKGELIWIAESDDFCESSFLKTLVQKFDYDEKLVLSFCRSQCVNSKGILIKKRTFDLFRNEHISGNEFVCRFMSLGNFCSNASACVFKKNAALKINKDYMKYKAAGDARFWVEIARYGNIAIEKKKLNYFRQHSNKVTPLKFLQGINLREAYLTRNFKLRNFKYSSFRASLMNDYFHNAILTHTFSDEKIRMELLTLWGFNSNINFFRKVRVLLFLKMHNRLNLYL